MLVYVRIHREYRGTYPTRANRTIVHLTPHWTSRPTEGSSQSVGLSINKCIVSAGLPAFEPAQDASFLRIQFGASGLRTTTCLPSTDLQARAPQQSDWSIHVKRRSHRYFLLRLRFHPFFLPFFIPPAHCPHFYNIALYFPCRPTKNCLAPAYLSNTKLTTQLSLCTITPAPTHPSSSSPLINTNSIQSLVPLTA